MFALVQACVWRFGIDNRKLVAAILLFMGSIPGRTGADTQGQDTSKFHDTLLGSAIQSDGPNLHTTAKSSGARAGQGFNTSHDALDRFFVRPRSSMPTKVARKNKRLCIKFKKPICEVYKVSKINRRNIMPYYNVHEGQVGVLFANGPTLNTYMHMELDSARRHIVTAGVNSIIHSVFANAIDYLFCADKGQKTMRGQKGTGWMSDPQGFNNFRPRITKFYGVFRQQPKFGPPLKGSGALAVEAGGVPTFAPRPLVKDVGNYEFGGSTSTTFFALQFLLYTGIKHIFLVGNDMGGGYFKEVGVGATLRGTIRNGKEIKSQIREWVVAKEFITNEYPDVNVTMVNPIGLRGRLVGWNEIYTESNKMSPLFGKV